MNVDALRQVRTVLLAWTLWSLLLHLGWELVQLPLYTLWRDPDVGRIAWSVIHWALRRRERRPRGAGT